MFSQGYIGVSKDHKKRWYDHGWRTENAHFNNAIKKYGWDNLQKKVILIAEENYCLNIEAKLRPTRNIGWNIAVGGGKPPSPLGKKFGPMSDETKAKVSASKKGFKHTPEIEAKVTQNLIVYGVPTRFKKGYTPWNKGIPSAPHVIEAVRKANIGRIQSEEEKQKRAKSMIGRPASNKLREHMRKIGLMSAVFNKGRKHEKVECPHCNKIGGITGMARWHFDNCKIKDSSNGIS